MEKKYKIKRKSLILSIVIIFIISSGVIGLLLIFLYFANVVNHGQYNTPLLRFPYSKYMKIEVIAKGLSAPTSMAFVGKSNENVLVLEKKGTVRLISHGILKQEPVLNLNVDSTGERGLLGVAAPFPHDNTKESRSIEDKGSDYSSIDNEVFLYYTEKDPSLRNRVYKYQWNGNQKHMMYRNADAELINPKLILDLPSEPSPHHRGGKLKISHDNKFLYTVIGDLNSLNSKLQNYKYGK